MVFSYVCKDENKMLSSIKVGWKLPIKWFCLINFLKPVCIWIHFVPNVNSVTVRHIFKTNDAEDFFNGICKSLKLPEQNLVFSRALNFSERKRGHSNCALNCGKKLCQRIKCSRPKNQFLSAIMSRNNNGSRRHLLGIFIDFYVDTVRFLFTIFSIFVGNMISLRATLQSPESWISSFKKFQNDASVFKPIVSIEADEKTQTVNSSWYWLLEIFIERQPDKL